MSVYATVDTSRFPLVFVTFTGNKATDDNFQHYLQDLSAIYDRKSALGIVFDASSADLPAFRYQRMQADWLAEHRDLIRTYCRGTAYVIPNPLLRPILKSIFALQGQPAPFQVVPERALAEDWVNHQLSS